MRAEAVRFRSSARIRVASMMAASALAKSGSWSRPCIYLVHAAAQDVPRHFRNGGSPIPVVVPTGQRFSVWTNPMSDDDDPVEDSATALRAKAAHCIAIAKFMGEETRARLLRFAADCLERAEKLEQSEKK